VKGLPGATVFTTYSVSAWPADRIARGRTGRAGRMPDRCSRNFLLEPQAMFFTYISSAASVAPHRPLPRVSWSVHRPVVTVRPFHVVGRRMSKTVRDRVFANLAPTTPSCPSNETSGFIYVPVRTLSRINTTRSITPRNDQFIASLLVPNVCLVSRARTGVFRALATACIGLVSIRGRRAVLGPRRSIRFPSVVSRVSPR